MQEYFIPIYVVIAKVQSLRDVAYKATDNFSHNSWGGISAHEKAQTRYILERLGLPYSKELGTFIRNVVTHKYDNEFLRSLIGFTLYEVLYFDIDE